MPCDRRSRSSTRSANAGCTTLANRSDVLLGPLEPRLPPADGVAHAVVAGSVRRAGAASARRAASPAGRRRPTQRRTRAQHDQRRPRAPTTKMYGAPTPTCRSTSQIAHETRRRRPRSRSRCGTRRRDRCRGGAARLRRSGGRRAGSSLVAPGSGRSRTARSSRPTPTSAAPPDDRIALERTGSRAGRARRAAGRTRSGPGRASPTRSAGCCSGPRGRARRANTAPAR